MGLLGWLTNLGMGGGTASAVTLSVWAKTGTHRSKRDAAADSGTAITMKQARNERRFFQILAHANSEVTNMDITPSLLSDGLGNTIAASNISVHRAHQLQIKVPTSQNNKAILDEEVLDGDGDGDEDDWYPDALIPTVHPVSGDTIVPGHTYQAFPYTLPENETHTFLVNIFVPEETEPGDYTGTVTVSADGQDDVVVTIALHVWTWSLPDTMALRTALWAGPTDIMYGLDNRTLLYANGWVESDFSTAKWEDEVAVNVNTVFSQCGIAAQPFHVETALDFRPEPDNAIGPYEVSGARVAALQAHIDDYHPSTIYLQHPDIYGGSFSNPVAEAEAYAAWIAAYAAGIATADLPDVTFAVYLKEEPYTLAKSDYVNLWGPPLLVGGVHSMITHAIATPIPDNTCESMIGSADVWTVPMQWYDHAFAIDEVTDTHVNTAVAARLAAGETVWLYTANSGNSDTGIRPWFGHIDRPLLNCRLLPWLCRSVGMTGLLYWAAGVHWWKVYANAPPDNDPWTNPLTHFTETKNFNGEGSLFYPADESSIGFYGMVPSLRAFALRDGIQDYGYFAVADTLGLDAEVDAIIDALITDFSHWNPDPDAYETAREALGDAIETASLHAILFDQGHLMGGMMAMAGGLA